MRVSRFDAANKNLIYRKEMSFDTSFDTKAITQTLSSKNQLKKFFVDYQSEKKCDYVFLVLMSLFLVEKDRKGKSLKIEKVPHTQTLSFRKHCTP